MVVMEYVDGNTFAVAKQKMSEESVEAVRSAVRHALELLHSVWCLVISPSLISADITWPEGVEALAVMKKEHDLAMLSRF